MTALDRIGDLRSAVNDEERARVLLSAIYEPRFEDLLRSAQGYDPRVLHPDRLVQWSKVTDSAGRDDRYEGRLAVCGAELIVPDMAQVTSRWASRPGWYVLDLWESDPWVQSDAGAIHRDAPRRCLEADPSDAAADAARVAARVAYAASDAALAASDAALAGYYAAIASAADYYNAATYAALAATYAARAATYAARVGGGVATYAARAAYAAFFHADWRWHLIHHALNHRGCS